MTAVIVLQTSSRSGTAWTKYDRPELRRETFTINIRISAEEDIPLYTLFVTIPRGVDSIDANTYYNGTQNASDHGISEQKLYAPETKLANGKEIEIGIRGESDSLEKYQPEAELQQI